jgi:hypothetical protein
VDHGGGSAWACGPVGARDRGGLAPPRIPLIPIPSPRNGMWKMP